MNLDQTCEVVFQLHKSSQIGFRWAKEFNREHEFSGAAKSKSRSIDFSQEKNKNDAYGIVP